MPRNPAFSNKRFLEAWGLHKDVRAVSKLLCVSMVTVYKYLKRNNVLTTTRKSKDELTKAIDAVFFGAMTIKELSFVFGVVNSDIRYHLRKAIRAKWLDDKKLAKRYPKPRRLIEYKIVKELIDHPEVFDHPDIIAESLRCFEATVVEYLTKVFNHRSK